MLSRRSIAAVAFITLTLLAGCGGEGRSPSATHQPLLSRSTSSGPLIHLTQNGRYLGDMDNDGLASVGDAIKILRIVVSLDSDDLCADANQNGSTDVGDAIKVLRCVVRLDTWPIGLCEPDEYSQSAAAPTGEALGATVVEDGEAYQGGFYIEVASPAPGTPDYAALIVKASEDFPNTQLAGITLHLKDPSGQVRATIQNGQVTYSGLADFPTPPTSLPGNIASYLTNTVGISEPSSIDDIDGQFQILNFFLADPNSPAPDSMVEALLDNYYNQITSVSNAKVASQDPDAPPAVHIVNPSPGRWRVDVQCPAGTEAFGIGAVYTPADSSVRTYLALEEKLSVLETVSSAQDPNSPECQEIKNSWAVKIISTWVGILPFPFTPRSAFIGGLSIMLGVGGFVVGAALVNPLLGFLIGYMVGQLIGKMLDALGWQDTWMQEIENQLTRLFDPDIAGIRFVVPPAYQYIGMFSYENQVFATGAYGFEFKVMRVLLNNCGREPVMAPSGVGTTTWSIEGNTALGAIVAEEENFATIKITGSYPDAGNFYVRSRFQSNDGKVDVTDRLRVVVGPFL